MRETDLYEPVRDFLTSNGYTVRSEVKGCDIAATRGDELVILEMKTALSVSLLAQAVERQRAADSVYVVVPHPGKRIRSREWRRICNLLKKLELGLVLVKLADGHASRAMDGIIDGSADRRADGDADGHADGHGDGHEGGPVDVNADGHERHADEPAGRRIDERANGQPDGQPNVHKHRSASVEIPFHPAVRTPRRRKDIRRAILDEAASRSGDFNVGGSTGRKLVTAYRETSIKIACFLQAMGTTSPLRLRQAGTGQKTASILYNNYYGWFERVARGRYQLTAKGADEIATYPDLAERYRKEAPAATGGTGDAGQVRS